MRRLDRNLLLNGRVMYPPRFVLPSEPSSRYNLPAIRSAQSSQLNPNPSRGKSMTHVAPNPVLTLSLVLLLSVSALAQAAPQLTAQPPPMPLWPAGAPGAKGTAPEDIPSIQLYQPTTDKATGAAIVV